MDRADIMPEEFDPNLARVLHQVGVPQEALKSCLAVVSERRGGVGRGAGRGVARAAGDPDRGPDRGADQAGRAGRDAPGREGRVAANLPRAPQLEGYRVLRPLAQGGMGAVYEAEDASGSRVAIKVIKRRGARTGDRSRGEPNRRARSG